MKCENANSGKKQLAGEWAAGLVQNGMTIGVGTGSTVLFFIKALKKRMEEEDLHFTAVATSFSTKCICEELGFDLKNISSVDSLDIAVDGADEVDDNFNGIKGGGAAQTLEKIVAHLAKRYVFIIDDGKKTDKLGKGFPVPVEVVPEAWRLVKNSIAKLGFDAEIRMAKRKDGPVITDNGNFVLDVTLDKEYDVAELNKNITMIPGVLETGFFIGYADTVVIGTDDGVEILKK